MKGEYYKCDGSLTLHLSDAYEFETIKAAQKFANAMISAGRFDFISYGYVMAALVALGLLFIFIPTIALFLITAAATIYALKWSRRAVKKVKVLSAALTEHKASSKADK